MGNNKRSKALNRVVKLLNLATSDVSHESDLALTHAHSIIYSHNFKRYEIDQDLLCDRSVLELIDWYGDWTTNKSTVDIQQNAASRAAGFYGFAKGIREKNTFHQKQQADAVSENISSEVSVETALDDEPGDGSGPLFDQVCDEEEADTLAKVDTQLNDQYSYHGPVYWDCLTDPTEEDDNDEAVASGYMAFDRQEVEPSPEVAAEDVDCEVNYSELNIDDVERSSSEATFRLQQLRDQLSRAGVDYERSQEARQQGDLDAAAEKAIRIQAEIEAEQAAERAFRLRAEAQQRWETEMRSMRQQRRLREQESLAKLTALQDEQNKLEQSLLDLAEHKAELERLALLKNISTQLSIAANPEETSGEDAFDHALKLMSDNRLGLTDLPLDQIHHKSVFIRLLERESSVIENTRERESFTEALLGKYLELYHPPAIDLAEQVLALLRQTAAAEDNDEIEYYFSKTQDLLTNNGMSIRDLDIGKIEQTSLFIRLLNWEADKLPDMGSREHFTAKMLDRYFDAILNS